MGVQVIRRIVLASALAWACAAPVEPCEPITFAHRTAMLDREAACPDFQAPPTCGPGRMQMPVDDACTYADTTFCSGGVVRERRYEWAGAGRDLLINVSFERIDDGCRIVEWYSGVGN